MPFVSRPLLLAAVALIALPAVSATAAEAPAKTNFSNQWRGDQGKPQKQKTQAKRQQPGQAPAQRQAVSGTWFGQPQVRQAQPASPWFSNRQQAQQQQRQQRPIFFGLFGGMPIDRQVVEQPSRQAAQAEIDAAPVVEEVEGAEIYDYKPPALVPLTDPKLAAPSGVGPDSTLAIALWERLKEGSAGVQVTAPQRDAIVAFYADRSFRPMWTGSPGNVEAAKQLEAVLANATAEGLDPGDYRVPTANADDPATQARRDLQLTAAAVRYAQHASGGRIVPNGLSGYQDRKPPTVEARTALKRLAEGEPERYLSSLHPTHPAYQAMRAELARVQKLPEAPQAIDDGPKIKIGSDDIRVPDIRKRLASLVSEGSLDVTNVSLEGGMEVAPVANEGEISGVLPVSAGPEKAETVYTAADSAAVRAFQDSVGLIADGIVGSATIAKLNESGGDRRQQLIANMERLRWLPRDLGKRHVFVNQAAFELEVVEDGQEVWGTRVIVGKPNTQTFEFSDVMETVEFNPYWGVPPSILNNEMLPKSRRDPSWLDRNGYEVVDSRGRVVSSSAVNWSAYSKNPPFSIRQPPGSDNALGEVKFLFPNEHHIYMHDTPTKSLFEKDMRAFSHGCVRVQDPRRFAEVILGWNEEQVAKAIGSGRNQGVKVKDPVHVHLTYFTAWPDESGRIRYFSDIYGRDRLIGEAMGKSELALR